MSFYKIVNIGFSDPKDQMKWINDNLIKVRDNFGASRLQEMGRRIPDIGHYMYVSGRTAIAHAYNDPIKDPDAPVDVRSARQETELMESLARIFIEDELKVPSLKQIFKEHLYELAGFKSLLGNAVVNRLKARETIPLAEFPSSPPLTIGLRVRHTDGLRYPCLSALPFLVRSCNSGIVILESDSAVQPMHVTLQLNFLEESLEFVLGRFGWNKTLATRETQICTYHFMIDYVSNGYLRIFDATSGERLSHKLALIMVNVDLGRTTEEFQRRIDLLQADERGDKK
jgi:hypothetical protein